MISWRKRSTEERTLLNPAFCSLLLWNAAKGHESNGIALPIEEAFIVLPLVLPSSTRNALPGIITTSLPVWIEENPIEQRLLAGRAKALLPFTRTAITFGAFHELLELQGKYIRASKLPPKKVKEFLDITSDEVRSCTSKAEFIGRWFAKVGSTSTIMTLLGVRP